MPFKTHPATVGLLALAPLTALASGQTYNYGEALQKSMFFYEAQRSGPVAPDAQVTWRGPSGLHDGADVGVDLVGGWYDAGDHVKFGFPLAFSATALAWGAIDFKDGYLAADQLENVQAHLRHVHDYLQRCHTGPTELWGQVGNGGLDHAWWGSAEVMRMSRPAYKIDEANPGSDLAGETAAAMAAASMVFHDVDPAYSAELIADAVQLWNFADTHRGLYSDSIPDAQTYYKSWSGYEDELCWGAIWLYRATGENAWLDRARDAYQLLGADANYDWGVSWDDKTNACSALMFAMTGESMFGDDIERHLDYWTTGHNGNQVLYTPGGLAWLSEWGSLRYSANTAFLAFFHHATTADKALRYRDFGVSQINYALGDNPLNRSYVCGFGNNPPVSPHHRTAHGAWANDINGSPTDTRHVLYGALVGGPDDQDAYSDDRADYIANEVTTDYNALFSGALAKMTLEFGGAPLVDFPPVEEPVDEYLVEVQRVIDDPRSTGVSVWVNNHTAWPARVPSKVRVRLFVDLSEGYALGLTKRDYSVSTSNPGKVTMGPLRVWDGPASIFYTEGIFWRGIDLWPGGLGESREVVQIQIGLNAPGAPDSAWDPANDPSLQGTTSSVVVTQAIPMYADGALVAGAPASTGFTRPAHPGPFGPGWPYLDLDVDSVVLDVTGGDATVMVSSNRPWDVTDDQPWITVTPPSGSNDGTFQIEVTPNSGGTRNGTVTVTGENITREVAVSQGGNGTCDNPIPIVLPFEFTGTGEHCWVTAEEIDHVNSWSAELVEINGVDVTNLYLEGADLPPKISGQYFIRFIGITEWAHFEAVDAP